MSIWNPLQLVLPICDLMHGYANVYDETQSSVFNLVWMSHFCLTTGRNISNYLPSSRFKRKQYSTGDFDGKD